ncbi:MULTISPECIES: bifunctional diguanylate cyclase/phosphodiesterase [Eubacteriales]|uniref:EAL domain, c-di-GMP-specific phosphodiesterase class I (Or its enzymatically inactive variant) n=1 Tax=Bittarella massiliensis (ex Durand et al. 2017) TaxID=1720313 RepID=A0AAQ1RUW5_9FIRM|nr:MULTISPECIES: EAL domain-containing protein [Eubacteriales]ERI98673.1 diguanylate cyclase domain protein [Clostridium sp. ATCC 29733]MZL68576.1 EAL domain-containing protein [Bittarella massiliensis (ex Durand et al. 2017)]MZL79369.1 EAL domain-containing protein [Bittarella massiliensis (ex Durand et al. 2017)]SHF65710.1 EAL domain, c-di-GMP-specific phosphodiesterase class I (or its enzymatically inactive variant) [Bittarella massiliensis (ex Durand et al. 2017)]
MQGQKKHLSQEVRRWVLVAMAALLVGIGAVAVWNAVALRQAVDRRTQQYLTDVSNQSAQLIRARIDGTMGQLVLTAEDLAAGVLSPEGLHARASFAKFDELAVVGPAGENPFTEDYSVDLGELPAFQSALNGARVFCPLPGKDGFLYLVPLARDGQVTGVLAGVKSSEKMRAIIDNDCFDGQGSTCVLDSDGAILVSPTQRPFSAFIAATQYSETEGWAQEMQEGLRQGRAGNVLLPTADGEEIWLDYRPIGDYGLYVATLIPRDLIAADVDLSTRRTIGFAVGAAVLLALLSAGGIIYQNWTRAQMRRVAFSDPVTGGYNNARFLWEGERLVRQRPAEGWAVIALNLKDFRLVNEVKGEENGDDLLRRVHRTLLQQLGEGELAARGEGDTFYLLAHGPQERLAARMEDLSTRLGDIDTAVGRLRVSQGGCPVDPADPDLGAAERRANLARRTVAEEYPSSAALFDGSFAVRQEEEIERLKELEQAFAREEFCIYLQPKYRQRDGHAEVAGAEALVRWVHPGRGLVPPGEFIPLCERTGLIRQLDLLVFEKVCLLLKRWAEQGLAEVPVSVNVSRQHMKTAHFLDSYRDILQRTGVDAHRLELELTENVLFTTREIGEARDLIERIHQLGMHCSLDDFGAGYSSLGLLKDLPVDTLKLDRQFFADSLHSPRSQAVVRSILSLARALEIESVAEGIEEEGQAAFLWEAGCDLIQGYLYAPPLPTAAFESLLPPANN